jgi:hypothetical protein
MEAEIIKKLQENKLPYFFLKQEDYNVPFFLGRVLKNR